MKSPVLRPLSRRPQSTTCKKIQRSKRSIPTGAWSFLFAMKRSLVAVVRGSNRRNLRFLRGRNDEIIHRFYNEQCVLVSESFARRFHLAEGETLHLPSPEGVKSFPIAGVFYDYTRDQGTVFLSEKNFQKFWHDDRVNSLGLYLKKGADPAAVAEAFRGRFSKGGEFSIYSNRLLRTRIFEIFDQTFAVTYVLRTIAVLVAVVGIFLGLTTLGDRARAGTGRDALDRGVGGANPAFASLGKRDDRPARQRAWAGFRTLSLNYPDRCDQSRVSSDGRFSSPSRGGPWPGPRSGSLPRRSWPDGFRRGGRDESISRRRCEANEGSGKFQISNGDWLALLALGCVAADWQVATPGWQI